MNARDLENILNELKLQRLSPSALKTFGEIVRWWRGRGQGNSQAPVNPQRWGKNVQWIKAASGTTGYLTQYNGYTDEWRDGTHLLQVKGVGGTPTSGERYLGVQTGKDASGRGKFTVLVPGAAAGGGAGANLLWYDNTDQRHLAAVLTTPNNNGAVLSDLRVTPFFAAAGTVDRIGVVVIGTGTAGKKYRLGIWEATSDTDSYPGALVVDSGAMNADVAPGFEEATISVTLQKDKLYYAGILPEWDAGSFQVNGWIGGSVFSFLGVLGVAATDLDVGNYLQGLGWAKTFITWTNQALPDPFPASATIVKSDVSTSHCVPAVWLRFAG